MSVFRMNSNVIIDDIYFQEIPISWRKARFYDVDIKKLIEEMGKEDLKYGGGRNYAAKIEFPGYNPDFSLVHVAFEEGYPREEYKSTPHWMVLYCPLGNVKKNGEAVVCNSAQSLRDSLYKPRPAAGFTAPQGDISFQVSNLLKTKSGIISVEEIIKTVKDEDTGIVEPLGPLISRTSLTKEILDYGINEPTLEELDEIFGITD